MAANFRRRGMTLKAILDILLYGQEEMINHLSLHCEFCLFMESCHIQVWYFLVCSQVVSWHGRGMEGGSFLWAWSNFVAVSSFRNYVVNLKREK